MGWYRRIALFGRHYWRSAQGTGYIPCRHGEVVIPTAEEQPSPEALSLVFSECCRPRGRERGKIDMNSAAVDTSETLPGIGPTRAAAIVQFRFTAATE